MKKGSSSNKAVLPDLKLECASTIFKLLGHPLRLRLLDILHVHGEETVNKLAELTGEPQSTVSLYLNRLKSSGLLKCRRSGNQRYYSLAGEDTGRLMSWVSESSL